MPDDREPLGRLVRETWVAWAKEQDDPKPGWLTGWDELDDGQREVDMRIGSAVEAKVRRRVAGEIRRGAERLWPLGLQRDLMYTAANWVVRGQEPS